MTSLFMRDTQPGRRSMIDVMAEDEGFAELIRPIVAGARARGVADAFELMGVAAVLIDGLGRVLHAGTRATWLLNGSVRFIEGHVLGIDAEVNAALQRLISAAVGSVPLEPQAESITIHKAGGSSLSIRALRLPHSEEGAAQLLRAILVVTEVVH